MRINFFICELQGFSFMQNVKAEQNFWNNKHEMSVIDIELYTMYLSKLPMFFLFESVSDLMYRMQAEL